MRGLCTGSCVGTMSLEVITGSVQATLCLFACSRPCNLCLQYVNLSLLLFTVASVFSLQQIDCLK